MGADGYIFGPDGEVVPGGAYCGPCGEKAVRGLNDLETTSGCWSFEPLRFPCKHSRDPDMCLECDLEAGKNA